MTTDIESESFDVFANMTDEEIVLDAQLNNNVLAQEYLLHKYRNFVRAKARSYFLSGAEERILFRRV